MHCGIACFGLLASPPVLADFARSWARARVLRQSLALLYFKATKGKALVDLEDPHTRIFRSVIEPPSLISFSITNFVCAVGLAVGPCG